MKKLSEGESIPSISLLNSNGKFVSLQSFRGKKIILFFYPKDMTPGCTTEACNLRDNYAVLQSKGFEIIGISTDNETSHTKFASKYQLPYFLLSDINKDAVNAFGVWGEKKFMGKTYHGTFRTTFIVDENGVILNRIDKVDTKNHSQQILKLISN
ncbi:MAG: thioredoxin-dependent thiol peroxidase [Flavobacteriales bacterium]|nr:thioredoxin-dependent thiol peroxidase [Flavobacteriales bacterium]